MKARTDALGQVTTFTYNVDNTLAGVTYTGSPSTVPLTPTVTFTYDPFFSRRSSMTDGLGTTVYTYYPITAVPALGAGRLQSVTSPVAGALGVMDTVSFSYDPLGRIVTTTVDGVPQGVAYDPLGTDVSRGDCLTPRWHRGGCQRPHLHLHAGWGWSQRVMGPGP